MFTVKGVLCPVCQLNPVHPGYLEGICEDCLADVWARYDVPGASSVKRRNQSPIETTELHPIEQAILRGEK